jgi:uncharacterized membrane protein YecN with MAPEG domain
MRRNIGVQLQLACFIVIAIALIWCVMQGLR